MVHALGSAINLDSRSRATRRTTSGGFLDIVSITDFPNIRLRCAIHSAESGSVVVIPRENKLVRLYIQLATTENTTEAGAKADRSKINPDGISESARRIMSPYKLSYRKLDWWTA